MKKITLIAFAGLLLSACNITKHATSIVGRYKGSTFWMGDPMDVSLKKDSTFHLNWVGVDYTGRWQITDKNQITLKFDTITDIAILLSSGTLNGKDMTAYFVNKNKIKVNGDVLKRID